MSFAEHLERIGLGAIRASIARAGPSDVERVLRGASVADEEIPILFSPAADPYIEELARRSAALTERRFGRVIQLYAPLYLSNECVNRCAYCGFSVERRVARRSLRPEEVAAEAGILHRAGFRHILLVSGESPRHVDLPYLTGVIRTLRGRFASLSLEIAPFDAAGYGALAGAGADGLVLYQETYDPELYRRYHTRGPKRRYDWRLGAIERGAEAGFRSLGIGALLGLGPWRLEAAVLALHARHLTRRCWRSRIGVSFPRIREAAGGFTPTHPVRNRDVAHMVFALRLLVPDAELVLSTRESAGFRDHLIGLGITRMSAGSRTNPGGYADPGGSEGQFEIDDRRPPGEVARAISARGHEPVWKDFDPAFTTPAPGLDPAGGRPNPLRRSLDSRGIVSS